MSDALAPALPASQPLPTGQPMPANPMQQGVAGIFAQWSNVGAFGVLGWVIWYVFTSLIPAQQELFVRELSALRTESREQNNKLVSALDELVREIREQRRSAAKD